MILNDKQDKVLSSSDSILMRSLCDDACSYMPWSEEAESEDRVC